MKAGTTLLGEGGEKMREKEERTQEDGVRRAQTCGAATTEGLMGMAGMRGKSGEKPGRTGAETEKPGTVRRRRNAAKERREARREARGRRCSARTTRGKSGAADNTSSPTRRERRA